MRLHSPMSEDGGGFVLFVVLVFLAVFADKGDRK